MKCKILFIHNSTPEYRMEFWLQLRKYAECDYLITNKNLSDKIYKFDNKKDKIEFLYWDSYKWSDIKKLITNYDCVILPPQDSLKEIYVAQKVINVCRRYRIQTVYWSEKWEADWACQPIMKKIKNLLQRRIIATIAIKSDACIASGSKANEYLLKIGVNKEKIGIAFDSSTSPISDSLNIRKRHSIENDKRIILFLGRIVTRKGCYQLIDSIKDKLEELNSILLICGDGEDIERCKQIAMHNDSIIFAGMVQPEERRCYYSQSDIFVIPSICEDGTIEAWGLTVNESLECGTPVVASDVVGAAWDLINEKSGIMFHSMDEVVKDIEILLNNPIDRDVVKRAYLKFNVENMAIGFANEVRRIINYDT